MKISFLFLHRLKSPVTTPTSYLPPPHSHDEEASEDAACSVRTAGFESDAFEEGDGHVIHYPVPPPSYEAPRVAHPPTPLRPDPMSGNRDFGAESEEWHPVPGGEAAPITPPLPVPVPPELLAIRCNLAARVEEAEILLQQTSRAAGNPLQPHIPSQAAQEMQAAGVGASEAELEWRDARKRSAASAARLDGIPLQHGASEVSRPAALPVAEADERQPQSQQELEGQQVEPRLVRLPAPASAQVADVAAFMQGVARRIGNIPVGTTIPQQGMQAFEQTRWSALNCPLLWEAASADERHPVLDWLVAAAAAAPDVVADDGMQLSDAIQST